MEDYRRQHDISEEIVEVDWNCVRWRRETEPEPAAENPPEVPQPADSPRLIPRSGSTRVATQRELELERELAGRRGDPVEPDQGIA